MIIRRGPYRKWKLSEMNREQVLFYTIRRYMFPLRILIIVVVLLILVKI